MASIQKTVNWFFSSYILTIPRIDFVLRLCRYSTSSFSVTIGLFSSSKVSSGSPSYRGGFFPKSIDIDPCIIIWIVQKFQEIDTRERFVSIIEVLFLRNYSLNSFIKVKISTLTIGKIPFNFFSYIATKPGRTPQSLIEVLFLRNYSFEFFHQGQWISTLTIGELDSIGLFSSSKVSARQGFFSYIFCNKTWTNTTIDFFYFFRYSHT